MARLAVYPLEVHVIRLLVVDANSVMRDVMARVVTDESELQLVGFASTLAEAIPQLARADVVLVSAELPGGAISMMRALVAAGGNVRMLAIDVPEGPASGYPYLAAGAADCLFVSDSFDDLFTKVRDLCQVFPLALASL
jgi:DNA-binding NarL/FixJ family response regulator